MWAFVAALAALSLVTGAARADWVNLSGAEVSPNIAEIYVLDDRVRVVLEVFIGDLAIFEALVPDEWLDADLVSKRPPAQERIEHFSQHVFQVQGPDGESLPALVELVEPRPGFEIGCPPR